MSARRLQRPADEDYFVEPWSETFLQGDLFDEVPFAIPAPPDAVVIDEGERRFVSGPFDATPAMLISPSCVIPAQGSDIPAGPTQLDLLAPPSASELTPVRLNAPALVAFSSTEDHANRLMAEACASWPTGRSPG
jgi:hypothetical protein